MANKDLLNQASQIFTNAYVYVVNQFLLDPREIQEPWLKIATQLPEIKNYVARVMYVEQTDGAKENTKLPNKTGGIIDFNPTRELPIFEDVFELGEQWNEKQTFHKNVLYDMLKRGDAETYVKSIAAKLLANDVKKLIVSKIVAKLLTSGSIDKTVGTKDLKTIIKSMLVRQETIATETPSNTRIDRDYTFPDGTTRKVKFRHQANANNYILVINSKYENEKAFNVDGTKFGPNQFNITYGDIVRIDLEESEKDLGLSDGDLSKYDAILIEMDAIRWGLVYDETMFQYIGDMRYSKEDFGRFGVYRQLDKYIVAFDNTANAPADLPTEDAILTETVPSA